MARLLEKERQHAIAEYGLREQRLTGDTRAIIFLIRRVGIKVLYLIPIELKHICM
jgi:hypothetical protein